MHCPFCGSTDTSVKDSRPAEDGRAIRRRRQCPQCEMRFTTYERIQAPELTVIKSNGHREAFDREKLSNSIHVCMRKRPVSDDDIERVVNRIIHHLEGAGDGEIQSSTIGEYVMKELAKLDRVGYIRFASVYKNFTQITDFDRFLDELKDSRLEKQK
jgi:transcriptional repressor NrdR